MEKKKIITFEEFKNNDIIKKYNYFKEDYDIVEDITQYCKRQIGQTISYEEIKEKLKNIDKDFLKLIIITEREIGYDNF